MYIKANLNNNNNKKRVTAIIMSALLAAGLMMGCGAKADAGGTYAAQEAPGSDVNEQVVQEVTAQGTEAQDPASSEPAEAQESSVEAIQLVNAGFIKASAYTRTLTIDGQTREIKGSYSGGHNFYDKPMRLELMNGKKAVVQGNGAEHKDYSAVALNNLDPVDLMGADNFTGLEVEGDTVTGTHKESGKQVTMTFQDGILTGMEGDGISLKTDLDSFPDE